MPASAHTAKLTRKEIGALLKFAVLARVSGFFDRVRPVMDPTWILDKVLGGLDIVGIHFIWLRLC